MKEAIKTLRDNNVNAFVLDLRDNRWLSFDVGLVNYNFGNLSGKHNFAYVWCSGGSFPEGIEIAKIW